MLSSQGDNPINGTNKHDEAYTANNIGRRGTVALKHWYRSERQFRLTRFVTRSKSTWISRYGKAEKRRRSYQVTACIERCIRNLRDPGSSTGSGREM